MYLLDTDVVSEIRKIAQGKANPDVAAWANGVETATLFISVITLQELEMGVLLAERKDRREGESLRKWLDRRVRPAFAGRSLPVDEKVAIRSAFLYVPQPRSFRDCLIAATALVHDLTLVTGKIGDFLGMGVKILDPWGNEII